MDADIRSLALKVAAAHSSGSEYLESGGITVTRLRGGRNNILYSIRAGENTYVCKLCISDERKRAHREITALRLLEAAGLDLAPQPVALDSSGSTLGYPAVFYRWLDGRLLEGPPTHEQLASLLSGLQQIHALKRENYLDFQVPEAWFHWFEYEPYLAELESFLALYGSWLAREDPDGRKLHERLGMLVRLCRQRLRGASLPDPSRAAASVGLCRVDPNLANCIWGADRKIRWVDWESSGWGDPALELAEIRWHSAWSGVSSEQHHWLRANYHADKVDAGFWERVSIWDQMVTTRWPFLILRRIWSSRQNGKASQKSSPDGGRDEKLQEEFLLNLERAETLAAGELPDV